MGDLPDAIAIHESSGLAYMTPRVLANEMEGQLDPTIVERAVSLWREPHRIGLMSRLNTAGAVRRYTPVGLPRRPLGSLAARVEVGLWARELMRIIGRPVLSVWYDRPSQYVRVGRLGEEVSVYFAHCDYKLDILGNPLEGAEQDERKMLDRVDVVFAASDALAAGLRERHRSVFLLPSGYDGRAFDSRRFTPRRGTSPRIGFAGYISGRVDFEAIHRMVERRPEWAFFFVGATSPDLGRELSSQGREESLWSRLVSLPNVSYAGAVPPGDVPALVNTFDVAIVPYVRSDFTMTSSPIKAYEYLALGRPVVSTRIPDLERLLPAIRFVDQPEEWESAVQEALPSAWDEPSICSRRRVVACHSNAERARYALEVIRGSAGGRLRARR